MINKIIFCRMNIYLRKIYILFVTQTFSVQKYISEMRYIFFYIFIYTYLFIYLFFSANNVYFVKNKYFFKKKYFFFNLVLQQMDNHRFQDLCIALCTRFSILCSKIVLMFSLGIFFKLLNQFAKKLLIVADMS